MRPDPTHMNIPLCAQIEHRWFSDVLQESLTLGQHMGVMNNLINCKIQEALDLWVAAEHHYPCTYVNHGIHITEYTDVAGALFHAADNKGASQEQIDQLINYFINIGKEDILNMQVAY